VEEGGELVFIRFHVWDRKMCVLPLQFFLDILIYFYNENKNSLSWKKGSAESELILSFPLFIFTLHHISLSLPYFIILFLSPFNLITVIIILIIIRIIIE